VTGLTVLALLLAGAVGTVVALTRDVTDQAIVHAAYGSVLALVFLLLRAPDVALAQVAVSGVLVPVLVLVALAKLREQDR
jgi:energy-converting hydrogenase B subunit D